MKTFTGNRMSLLDRLLSPLILGLIKVYQLTLSLFIGQQCRFHPTCSHYMAEAIQIHGVIKGVKMGSKRLSHCHPWHEGGYDPVPAKKQ